MIITNTIWHKDHEFTSSLEHNTIKIDGARKKGFNTKALLLSGLAACSGIDIVDILKKMRVEFSHFSIEVKAAQTEDPPKVYKDIYITYRIKTDKENEKKVKNAIDLSLEKYCGVSAMLQKNSPIHHTLEIL